MDFKFKQISSLKFIVVTTLFLVFLYNLPTIFDRFDFYSRPHLSASSFCFYLIEIFVSYFFLVLTLSLLSLNRILLKIFLTLLFLLSTIYFYILEKYGTIFDEVMISNALDSVGHVGDVVDFSLIFYILFGAIIPIFIIWRIKIILSSIKNNIIFLSSNLALLLILLIFLQSNKALSNASTIYSPINYTSSIWRYYQRFYVELKESKNRIPLSKIYDFSYQPKLENLNVIFIIGESLRADHLGLNGYARNTTPLLGKQKNLLNFTISASFNVTTRSVTAMFSHRNNKDFVDVPPEKSAVSVFDDIGFNTFWYSTQSSKEFVNNMLVIMASEADEYVFRDQIRKELALDQEIYDEALLPHLKKALQQNNKNNFIVLHSFGSHIRYHQRYPKEFRIFTPECTKNGSSCKRQFLANSYDNSVLYTDYFITQVLEAVKNTNAIVFFVSDHGSFLGEHSIYSNGSSNTIGQKVHRVPMFLYMTDSVLKNNFYRKKFLNAKNKINKNNLSHANVFDSMLDCIGVESKLFDRNLSICK